MALWIAASRHCGFLLLVGLSPLLLLALRRIWLFIHRKRQRPDGTRAGPSGPAPDPRPTFDLSRADPNGLNPSRADPSGLNPSRADPSGLNPSRAGPTAGRAGGAVQRRGVVLAINNGLPAEDGRSSPTDQLVAELSRVRSASGRVWSGISLPPSNASAGDCYKALMQCLSGNDSDSIDTALIAFGGYTAGTECGQIYLIPPSDFNSKARDYSKWISLMPFAKALVSLARGLKRLFIILDACNLELPKDFPLIDHRPFPPRRLTQPYGQYVLLVAESDNIRRNGVAIRKLANQIATTTDGILSVHDLIEQFRASVAPHYMRSTLRDAPEDPTAPHNRESLI